MIDMSSLQLRIGSRKFLCDAAEFATALRTQFGSIMHCGQAKIAGAKKVTGDFSPCTVRQVSGPS
jgi:hypothetical protein